MPDPQTLVVTQPPQGYTKSVTASVTVSNDDLATASGVDGGTISSTNRIAGYRVEYTSPSGAVIQDTGGHLPERG